MLHTCIHTIQLSWLDTLLCNFFRALDLGQRLTLQVLLRHRENQVWVTLHIQWPMRANDSMRKRRLGGMPCLSISHPFSSAHMVSHKGSSLTTRHYFIVVFVPKCLTLLAQMHEKTAVRVKAWSHLCECESRNIFSLANFTLDGTRDHAKNGYGRLRVVGPLTCESWRSWVCQNMHLCTS